MTTLRPFGPSVIFTALLRISTPRRMRSRASVEKRTSLAVIVTSPKEGTHVGRAVGLADDAQDVAFLHDEQVIAVDLDLGAGPFSEEDAVAGLDVEGGELAGFIATTGTHSDDLTFLRLLLDGIGDDDATFGLLFALEALNHHAVVQGTECHVVSFLFWAGGSAIGSDRGKRIK